jgi:hypothetical protein
MALPEAAGQVELRAMARLLASDMREELLVLLREILSATPTPSGSPTARVGPLTCWAFPAP